MRYAVSSHIKIEEYLDFDVVIVGTGLAGLYTALHTDKNRSCCILTKERLDDSSSWLAQGGIAAAVADDDAPGLHSKDTLIAGAGLCDEKAVKVLVDEGPNDIRTLRAMRVPFDQNELGELLIAREGGHRRRRVLRAGGDATGRETVKTLAALAAERENITLMGRAFLVDVLLDEIGAVCGALIHAQGAYRVIRTRFLVIATGGIGQVYQTTTNPEVATGDGLAAAMRAGAKLADMEFIQFHPTGLWKEKQNGQAFLVSEALRGEGAVLRNADGTAFMENAHELKDLAPRDIVARAIVSEMERTRADHVYLDIRHLERDFLLERFPTIFKQCLGAGIAISRDLIPVSPVQHYLIGGIATDLYGLTNIPGLYACGEAASTGVHGANRLAANSMLECLVFGRRVAESMNQITNCKLQCTDDYVPPIPARPDFTVDESALRRRVQEIMRIHGSVVRNGAELTEALAEIRAIRQKLEAGFDNRRVYIELLNIVTVAEAILEGALRRTESVGAHYRRDSFMELPIGTDDLLRRALDEDIGAGDITTLACVSADALSHGRFVAKEPGVICGLEVLARVFALLDPAVTVTPLAADGDRMETGAVIAEITGPSRAVLQGERLALNLLQRLSGIAARTAEAVAEVAGTGAKILDTRKTTPGLRALEKYAVKTGGGTNHRFGLFDAVLIKDNHIAAAGGITAAVDAVRRSGLADTVRVEVETTSLAEVEEALAVGADIIMLDNMDCAMMRDAVRLIAGRAKTEASGNMGERGLREVAETGVDYISIGALTHTVRAMDISLKFD